MGADFCLAYVGIGKGKEPDWTAAEALVGRMEKTHLSKWKDFSEIGDPSYLFGTNGVEQASTQSEDALDMNDRTALVERAKKVLRDFREIWDSGTRDTVILEIRDVSYVFSGGMSWGDAPTESYETINAFLEFGLAKAAGFEY